MKTLYIQAKPNQRYLSEVLKDYGNALPKNCLFDKVTTGCGGTYVALTSPEPYVIAVPTKALVEDKIKSQGYANVKLIAVSGDHKYQDHSGTEHNGIPKGYDKVICTYHQLGNILRHINPSEWNLLIDEMHLLSRLVTFSPSVLRDILQYYPLFKSYCFMSATIPKTEHLLPGIKDIDRVTMVWPHVTPITFQGYKAATAKIAPELSARNKSRLNAGKKPSTKDMVEIFKTDPEFILEVDPDLHSWLSVLGVEKAEALQARRGSIKSAYDKKIASSQYMSKQMLKHWFKVGNIYRPEEIKVKVQNRTGIVPKSTQEALKLVRKYYEVKATVRKGFKVYSIVRIL